MYAATWHDHVPALLEHLSEVCAWTVQTALNAPRTGPVTVAGGPYCRPTALTQEAS